MNAEQLGEIYTDTCHAMTRVGEDNIELFLGRLVLLLMHEIGAPEQIRNAIAEAELGLEKPHI
jgi:hypothetical protein